MSKHKVTLEVDPDKLGVASRHHFRMANDKSYRERALTAPGGEAPDVELPEHDGLTAAALVGAAAE